MYWAYKMPTGVYKRTKYTKYLMSEAHSGSNNHMWGKKTSNETKEKQSRIKIGKYVNEKSSLWKGEDVEYRGLHNWIGKVLGKPEMCTFCKKDGLKGHAIHWANKSKEYKREIEDWLRLCAKCHKNYDKHKCYITSQT